jgi:hypothetical protein
MPTNLVCPICGQEFECNGAHDGPHDVLEPIKKCPLSKGAIYVFVRDNRQLGVPKAKIYCEGSQEKEADTDSQGFAFFDRLDPAPHPTRVQVDKSDESVQNGYYATVRTSVTPKVEAGKITMVEFALNAYGTLVAILQPTDDIGDLPPVTFEVSSPNHTPEESSKPATKDRAQFGKLKPTELYKVSCKISQDHLKSFKLEKDVEPEQKVTSAKPTEVIFKIARRHWVDLLLKDPKDDKLTGAFSLQQAGLAGQVAKGIGIAVQSITDLKPGTIDIEGVDLAESREFARIS